MINSASSFNIYPLIMEKTFSFPCTEKYKKLSQDHVKPIHNSTPLRHGDLLTANCVFMLLSPPYLLLPDRRPSAGWESLSKVGLCDAAGGVTKTGPIIGNFLTFWWFCLLITAGYWLQTIWETFFHIENSILYFDNYCFPEKASMLWRLTKINHFLLSLVVAWSGSSQIWSLL